MDIKRIDPVRNKELTEFLGRCPDTTLFHSPAWHAFIEKTYSHHCDYWVAWSNHKIVGVFPVVNVSFPFLGSKLVAMPYQMYSGFPIAIQEDALMPLVKKVVSAAKKGTAKYLEIRHFTPCPQLTETGFVSVDSQLITASVNLEGLDIGNFRKTRRQEIKYATRRGINIHLSSKLDDLKSFRWLYLDEGRSLGSPRPGWDYFENMFRLLPDACRLIIAKNNSGRCLGGYLTLIDGHHAFARYAAYSTQEGNQLRLGKALNWHAMKDAAEQGCKSFNMGITWNQDTGLLSFKESWGAKTCPVYQYVLPIHAEAPSPGDYFGGFNLAKTVWRHLPLPIVNLLGTQVTRWIC